MINFDDFFRETAALPIGRYHGQLAGVIREQVDKRPHGDLNKWHESFTQLPDVTPAQVDINGDSVVIGTARQIDHRQRRILLQHLQMLHPWRKGPWDLFGIAIDAEWRSNQKWDRLAPHITSLRRRLVLDVGCGNGYYGFRMQAYRPAYVVGIDPSQQYLMQFRTFKKYIPGLPLQCLPLQDEHLPLAMPIFDTVFSMGVIYHRREPLDHVNRLMSWLRPGGELILETLVIEGGTDDVLKPSGRYAQMANVHVIPSSECMVTWLKTAGFADIRLVDETRTTVHEQRQTEWMHYHSLRDFLDHDDDTRTSEGYPAPVRAVFICRKQPGNNHCR